MGEWVWRTRRTGFGRILHDVTRKVLHPLPISSARQIIEDYEAGWTVYPTTPGTVLKAITGVESHQLSFWDAMIWASAVINGVSTIYSEDMQDGQIVEDVLIKNPLSARTAS